MEADPPEQEIVCVDCGGRCFLLTPPREDGSWSAGDIVSYRCQDCRDRWDLELPATENSDGWADGGPGALT